MKLTVGCQLYYLDENCLLLIVSVFLVFLAKLIEILHAIFYLFEFGLVYVFFIRELRACVCVCTCVYNGWGRGNQPLYLCLVLFIIISFVYYYFQIIKIVRVSLNDQSHATFNWLNRQAYWFLQEEFDLPVKFINIILILSTWP